MHRDDVAKNTSADRSSGPGMALQGDPKLG